MIILGKSLKEDLGRCRCQGYTAVTLRIAAHSGPVELGATERSLQQQKAQDESKNCSKAKNASKLLTQKYIAEP